MKSVDYALKTASGIAVASCGRVRRAIIKSKRKALPRVPGTVAVGLAVTVAVTGFVWAMSRRISSRRDRRADEPNNLSDIGWSKSPSVESEDDAALLDNHSRRNRPKIVARAVHN